ncbi:MAG: type II toxin-antitoxin system VapC family toxin [Planctomycetes bacterium]|nr:type II toxin-antitoxin system VapC family toxin [Planctomycetota bacterium]
MRVLLDTNIIIRAAQPNQPTWADISQALTTLVAHGCSLCVVPQNIYEFWVVATRPQTLNGFGLTPTHAKALIDGMIDKLSVLRDERGILDLWLSLVDQYAVEGKSAHDTRLVAAMQRHSIANLLTINKSDFARFPITVLTPQEVNAGSTPT